MARNNTVSASFGMASGDGASGFTVGVSSTNFTSGDAVNIQGTIGTGEVVYKASDYGLAQFDGIYVENRDDTNHLEVDLFTDAGGTTSIFATSKHFEIAPGGCFMIRFDAAQDAILAVGLTGESAGVEFVLALAE